MKKFYRKVKSYHYPTQWRTATLQSRLRRPISQQYNVEEVQKQFEKTLSLPNNLYCTDAVSSGSSGTYEDDTEDSEQEEETRNNSKTDRNASCVADVVATTEQTVVTEYDVPRISFKFFGGDVEEHYTSGKVRKRSCSDEIDSVTGTIKADSDPNLAVKPTSTQSTVPATNSSTDNLYQVPRKLSVLKHREKQKSLSLNDFSKKQKTSTNEAIRLHSNINGVCRTHFASVQHPASSTSNFSLKDSLFFKQRPKPVHLSNGHLGNSSNKVNGNRKKRNAVDALKQFKEKISVALNEHVANQRVGAYTDHDKYVINIEDILKRSTEKCKKALRTTSHTIFNRKHWQRLNHQQQCRSSSKWSLNKSKSPTTNGSTNSTVQTDGHKSGGKSTKTSRSFSDFSKVKLNSTMTIDGLVTDIKHDLYFTTLRKNVLQRRKFGEFDNQSGSFDEIRRYIKQGGDFCKELSCILQECADAEAQYSKSLLKLSGKLSRACRDGVGTLNDAWKQVAIELERKSDAHRQCSAAILEETARPLRTLSEAQHRIRKQSEAATEKTARSLVDWRAAEAKSKKLSHACSRENERLQNQAILDASRANRMTLSRSTSLGHLHNVQKMNSEKVAAKFVNKKKKAEDAVKKADVEYYNLCVRAERARLEWESTILSGINTFQTLEEERLNHLKTILGAYLLHNTGLTPKLMQASEMLKRPILDADPTKDLTTFITLRQSSQQICEQLLPDFYCEHITLAMNRERRKQALIKLQHLIRHDIERERKSKIGLENLSNAIKQTPNFGNEDSQQNVSEKLYHMQSMLTYLEGARFKVQSALTEFDGHHQKSSQDNHPLAAYITITRDRSGLQSSILRVPQWFKDEWCLNLVSETTENSPPLSEKMLKSDDSDGQNWSQDRGAADGNSNQLDSDFDEFSSQESIADKDTRGLMLDDGVIEPIARCKALYAYTPNFNDELTLHPGDLLSVYKQQEDGWWLGECSGNVGIFPATYVEIVH